MNTEETVQNIRDRMQKEIDRARLERTRAEKTGLEILQELTPDITWQMSQGKLNQNFIFYATLKFENAQLEIRAILDGVNIRFYVDDSWNWQFASFTLLVESEYKYEWGRFLTGY